MEIKVLEPKFDSRKSFYGKARVLYTEDKIQLESYNTVVAEIDRNKNKAVIHGFYSPTTLRHIKDFLYQHGFPVGTKAELEKMYC